MKLCRSIVGACGLLLAGAASEARGQDRPYDGDDVFEPTITRPAGAEHISSGVGVSIQAGGGVTNFLSQNTRDFTNVGGTWDLRTVMATRSIVALELAYVGTAQDIRAPGLDPNALLVGNGAEAGLRIHAPLVLGQGYLFEPFIFGGVGWRHYSVVNDDFNLSSVAEEDNTVTLPLGAGLAFGSQGLIVDMRFTYRPAFEEDLFPVPAGIGVESADLQNWSASLQLGYEF